MVYLPKKFTVKEKRAYIKALSYILSLNLPPNTEKIEHLRLQIQEIGSSEKDCESLDHPCTIEALVKTLHAVEDMRVRRYIIREMIMLAVADHEISDIEIKNIYQIADAIGISGEKVGDFFIWAAKGIEWKIEGIQLVEEDL